MKIEILKSQVVREHVQGQQLLAVYVNGVFRHLIALAQRALSSSHLDLRDKGLLCGRGENHGAISTGTEFQAAEEARVVKEEAGVGRSRRHDVTGDRGGKEGLSVNQRQVIDFARFSILI